MPQNYFITGQPKAGKTTMLKELVAELKKSGLSVGGFVSPEERHHGTRTAFQVMDVDSGKKANLASVDGDGPKVSKYYVNVKSFESIAVPSMERCDSYDVFVIDEIGVMEMKSSRFARLLDRILESDTPLIATLHEHFIDTFGGSGEVLDLDKENRGQVYQRLLRHAKRSITKKPPAPAAKGMPAPKKEPAKKAEKAPKAKKEPKKAAPPKAKKAAAQKKAPSPPPKTMRAEAPRVEEMEPEPPKEARESQRPPEYTDDKATLEEMKRAGEKEEERHKKKKEEMADAEEQEEARHKKKKEGILGRLRKIFGG